MGTEQKELSPADRKTIKEETWTKASTMSSAHIQEKVDSLLTVIVSGTLDDLDLLTAKAKIKHYNAVVMRRSGREVEVSD